MKEILFETETTKITLIDKKKVIKDVKFNDNTTKNITSYKNYNNNILIKKSGILIVPEINQVYMINYIFENFNKRERKYFTNIKNVDLKENNITFEMQYYDCALTDIFDSLYFNEKISILTQIVNILIILEKYKIIHNDLYMTNIFLKNYKVSNIENIYKVYFSDFEFACKCEEPVIIPKIDNNNIKIIVNEWHPMVDLFTIIFDMYYENKEPMFNMFLNKILSWMLDCNINDLQSYIDKYTLLNNFNKEFLNDKNIKLKTIYEFKEKFIDNMFLEIS